MIFLSKDGTDEYINMLATGCSAGVTSTHDFLYSDSTQPIILRGILKHKIIKQCWIDQRDFFYVDSGYFGNEITDANPGGWKHWHRIVKNDLQHREIIKRPPDRFVRHGKTIHPWKKSGRSILVATPDSKPCKFYEVNRAKWIDQTVSQIRQHTDRPIIIRDRVKSRNQRVVHTPLSVALSANIFALVTFNSISATESIFNGIPAFTMAPCNAASPVSLQDLSQIETPYYADRDKVYAWACHLAYGQYHIDEIKNGIAQSIMGISK